MDDLFIFVFTRIASTEGLILAIALILFILWRLGKRREAHKLLLSTLGMMVSVQLLKELFQVTRPEGGLIETTGYAFPSGHAAGSLFLALIIAMLAYRLSPPLRYGVYVAAGLAAFTIGISRIYFGVHTPFQVAMGFVVGALWASLYVLALRLPSAKN